MKSPFPGMDPYIETCGMWGDFHLGLISQIKQSFADTAPERYIIRSRYRTYWELDEEHREAFIVISEFDDATREQCLVTCIEVLSPSNKRPGSEGWNAFQRTRQSMLLGGLNLVEIDLLRGGERMPMLEPWPKSPYTILVARPLKESTCRVWPASFQHALHPVHVPLADPDADLPMDLQPMIDAIYARGRYERSIDYRKPLTPPLNPDEAAWLQRQLRARNNFA